MDILRFTTRVSHGSADDVSSLLWWHVEWTWPENVPSYFQLDHILGTTVIYLSSFGLHLLFLKRTFMFGDPYSTACYGSLTTDKRFHCMQTHIILLVFSPSSPIMAAALRFLLPFCTRSFTTLMPPPSHSPMHHDPPDK